MVISTPLAKWQAFIGYFILISLLILLSKLPLLYVLKRSLVIIPFVLLICVFNLFFKSGEVVASFNIWKWQISITDEGLHILLNVLIKAFLSTLSLILLTSTTRFTQLLKGLEQLRMPKVMVMTLSFMYRYIFVLVDEVMRMRRARDSRNFGGKRIWQMQTISNMVGTLFLRSYERGERVYMAMVSRGYDGEIQTLSPLSFSQRDAYFGTTVGIFLASVFFITLFWQV